MDSDQQVVNEELSLSAASTRNSWQAYLNVKIATPALTWHIKKPNVASKVDLNQRCSDMKLKPRVSRFATDLGLIAKGETGRVRIQKLVLFASSLRVPNCPNLDGAEDHPDRFSRHILKYSR